MTRPLKPRTSRLAPRLVAESGPHKGNEYVIRKPLTTIGRSETCDLIVDDPLVSRRHCQIVWDGVYCTVEDLGSTNGTFVKDQRLVEPHILRSGDAIRVAGTVLSFTDPQSTLVGRRSPKLIVEPATKRVTVNDKLIELSAKEYALLAYLNKHSDRVCSKESIARAVWPEYQGDVFDYQVESLVKRLRKKLEPDAEESHIVMTIYGKGYRLLKL
jgi:pSer/pThr/pTyr-binding forkhead associated (FHA) protein